MLGAILHILNSHDLELGLQGKFIGIDPEGQHRNETAQHRNDFNSLQIVRRAKFFSDMDSVLCTVWATII